MNESINPFKGLKSDIFVFRVDVVVVVVTIVVLAACLACLPGITLVYKYTVVHIP